MTYNIIETSIYSDNIKTIYSAQIKFDANISSYFANGMHITITEMPYNGTMLEITNEDIANGNYTLITGTTIEDRLYESLKASGGFVAYLGANDIINIAMAAKSSNGLKTIGFYSSTVKIEFLENDNVIETATLIAELFPTILRGRELTQYNPASQDPVFAAPGIRSVYDFNQGIDMDVSRFTYNTTDTLYVNTSGTVDMPDTVPLYVSDISAFGLNSVDMVPYDFYYDWDYAESYLYNIDTGSRTDIRWLPGGTPEPEITHIEILPGYFADMCLYSIKQLIYKDAPGFYRNKLCFNLRSHKDEIE